MNQFTSSTAYVVTTHGLFNQLLKLSFGILFFICPLLTQAQCDPDDPTAANGTSYCAPSPTCAAGNFLWSQSINQNNGDPSQFKLVGGSMEWWVMPKELYPAAFAGPVTITITEVVSYDGYATRDAVPPQTNERWKIVFQKNGVYVAETPYTNDLADLQKQAYWRGPLGGSMYFPNGIDTIMFFHENFPGGNGGTGSVAPTSVCINYTSSNLGSIGDRVWLDENCDGIQNPNETSGISGVTVNLRNSSNMIVGTTVTDANGFYQFTGLTAGNYTVEFPVSVNGGTATLTSPGAGFDPNVDSDPNQTTGLTSVITLANGQQITNVDAGYCLNKLSLGNYVWRDTNNNGLVDGGESGISNAEVSLFKDDNDDNIPDGAAIAVTNTNLSGVYAFNNLLPGNYIVAVTTPAGMVSSSVNGGDPDNNIDNDDNGLTTSGGKTYGNAITLTVGGEPGGNLNFTYDFGFVQVVFPPIPPNSTYCYQSCTGNTTVGATQAVYNNGNGTTTIRTTFSKGFVDNCYKPSGNADNWNRTHKFGDLVGSDKLQLRLYNGNGALSMDFYIDYISSSSAAPSGYKSLGVSGGEGKMNTGSASDVVNATTSLDNNLNSNGPSYYGLITTSPATNASYTPNATYPNWIYDVWYEVTVKNSAFGSSGFGYPRITSVHASPSKTGSNSECVEPCPAMTVSATGNNGPCGTTCQGSITVTPANGTPPYTYTWVDNGQASPVTTQNRTNLCAGTYTVTVHDAANATASATVVITNPPANCPPPGICYQSCTGNPAVSATQTVTNNGNGTTTIRTTLSKTFVDNCYKASGNADNWNRSHTFSNLTGSDKLQLSLYNGDGALSMDFYIDYISSSSAAPSGYKSLGVSGGEGKMNTGSASDVVNATTSLDKNLNSNGPSYYGLITTSPATNASYTPNATYPNWIYEVWYEVTVKNSAFGSSGFGYPRISSVHASPSKTGSNSECVEPCTSPRGSLVEHTEMEPGIISTETESPAGAAIMTQQPEQTEQFTVNVYPNPSAYDFTILVNSKSTDPITIRILDMNGSIRMVNTTVVKSNAIRVGSTLAGGTYIAEVSQGNKRKMVKLVKLK